MNVDRHHVDACPQCCRRVAEFRLELVDLLRFQVAAHRTKVGRAGNQRRRGGGRSFPFNFDLHVGVKPLETFGPQ